MIAFTLRPFDAYGTKPHFLGKEVGLSILKLPLLLMRAA
jgi:hypothetical protein